MESVDCLKPNPEVNGALCPAGAEWHSIALEEQPLRSEAERSCRMSEGKHMTLISRNVVALSMCGLSKFLGGDANEQTNVLPVHTASKIDSKSTSIKSVEDCDEEEVRVGIHGWEDPKKCSGNVIFKTGSEGTNECDQILGRGDESCLPLQHQVRAFVRSAKFSCTGLLSSDGKPFLLNGWVSLLQRSFSFKWCESSSSFDFESICKNSNRLTRTTSVGNCGSPETLKASFLQAMDPAARAELLPLAHYRPNDGVIRKGADAETGQIASAIKSPVHLNCKKPPKPQRHPVRSTSLDSATTAAQFAARKSKERSSSKYRSRTASAASISLTPLIALVLTIRFGILMVFQDTPSTAGVFVETHVFYERHADGALIDVAANSQPSFPAQKAVAYDILHPQIPEVPPSLNGAVKKFEVGTSGAFQKKKMTELPWSRSSLASQIKSTLG